MSSSVKNGSDQQFRPITPDGRTSASLKWGDRVVTPVTTITMYRDKLGVDDRMIASIRYCYHCGVNGGNGRDTPAAIVSYQGHNYAISVGPPGIYQVAVTKAQQIYYVRVECTPCYCNARDGVFNFQPYY